MIEFGIEFGWDLQIDAVRRRQPEVFYREGTSLVMLTQLLLCLLSLNQYVELRGGTALVMLAELLL